MRKVTIALTPLQAKFLRAVLFTHSLVCVPATASRANAIVKKIDRACTSTRGQA